METCSAPPFWNYAPRASKNPEPSICEVEKDLFQQPLEFGEIQKFSRLTEQAGESIQQIYSKLYFRVKKTPGHNYTF